MKARGALTRKATKMASAVGSDWSSSSASLHPALLLGAVFGAAAAAGPL